MAPSEVTLKFGAESQVFELEPGGELNALAIKDCFGLQTVKLDGKVVSVNQSNGLTYRTFQHGETISVEGTAGAVVSDRVGVLEQKVGILQEQVDGLLCVELLNTSSVISDAFFVDGRQPPTRRGAAFGVCWSWKAVAGCSRPC